MLSVYFCSIYVDIIQIYWYLILLEGDDYCEDEDDFDNGGFSVVGFCFQFLFVGDKPINE